MKKSPLLAAAFGLFAGTCMAQAVPAAAPQSTRPEAPPSTVQIYGLLDLSLGKYDATTARTLGTGATSFIGFRGSEDLGGGWRAIFQLENQIRPDTGTQYNSSAFFGGRSTVGLEGPWGRLNLGRDVNASHYAEVLSDPFGQNGLPSGYQARGGISQGNNAPGLIETVRTNNSVNYSYIASTLTFRAQTAFREGADPTGNTPYAASVVYSNGPLQAGVSYIDPSKPNDHWAYAAANYNFGAFKLYGGIGSGQNTFRQAIRNQIGGVQIPIGAGLLMGTVSRTTANGTTIQTRGALGYYYYLSKRTAIYTDVVYDDKAGVYFYGDNGWSGSGSRMGRAGYDVGIRHLF